MEYDNKYLNGTRQVTNGTGQVTNGSAIGIAPGHSINEPCIITVKDIETDYVKQMRQEWKHALNSIFGSEFLYRIIDIKVIVPDKVLEFTFNDGTKEKTVCDDSDTFSLESAITIALCKKCMGGTSKYNKAVRDAIKLYEKKIKEEELAKEEQERIEKKRAKRKERKKRREAKEREEEKERQIEIQAEAYIRAMNYMKGL